MIRTSKQSDIPQIVSLWRTCFGDSDEYIRSFLSIIGTPERCLVVELENKIASMIFMLPAKMNVAGTSRDVIYIYACATSPEFREKGVMRDLLEAAYKQAVEQSAFALILIPASEKLSAYYQKIGFLPFFCKTKFRLAAVDKLLTEPLNKDTISEIIAIRKRNLTSDFACHWPDNHLRFALNELADDGVKAFISENSYVLFSPENQVVEALPLEQYQLSTDEEFALIRFCENAILPDFEKPYFNFGLD
ncbi:MAG: GNAT family N-acetyltransferase [Bacteroidales bacterium]